MANEDPDQFSDEPAVPEDGARDVDGADEIDLPRREASARFVIDAADTAQAQMRQALDPATRSLAEALRLSYRLLQLGIVALVVIFVFSGFQTVREGYTGVKTIFGKIVGEPGEEQLAPGLQPFWPYPIGELVVFEQRRAIRLDTEFQPTKRGNQTTKEDQIAAASELRELHAGRDGWVITADGDLAHLAIAAEYSVSDAVEFLTQFPPDRADEVVRRSIMRGAVAAASQFTLKDLMEQRDAPVQAIRERAQEQLDSIKSGITITSLVLSDRAPPRLIDARFREVQARREDAKAAVERARQEVAATLTGVAGESAFPDLVALIQEYDASLQRGDRVESDAILERISARFDADDVGGEAARIVQRAKAHEANLRSQLEADNKRIEGYATAFRENPRQLTRQLWLDAYRTVLTGENVEIFATPMSIGGLAVRAVSSRDVMQGRRTADLDRKKRDAEMKNQSFQYDTLRGSEMSIGAPGRRLERGATRGFGQE